MATAEVQIDFDDVPVEVEAAIPGPELRVSELLALRVGSVISTDWPAGENMAILAGAVRIGCGELSHATRGTIVRMVRFGGED